MRSNIQHYLKSIRLWQWVKNIVVFTLPLGVGSASSEIITNVFISFLGISLISSSTYITNDINDISIDKLHPIKKMRPIAAGLIDVRKARFLSIILLLLGFLLLNYLNLPTFLFGLLYFCSGLLYTLKIKFIPYLDTLLISFLFLIRVLIGGSAVNIQPSLYLTSFVFFSSACLALSKRISIYLDQRISNHSQYKQFLLANYKIELLNNLFKFSASVSLTTYFLWLILVKFDSTLNISELFLTISFVFLIRIFYGILILSNSSELEDFVKALVSNKKELIYSLISFLSLLIGIYV